MLFPTNVKPKTRELTQLLAQFFSNPLFSAPHAFSAASLFVKLSIIEFLSRHWKYASLASQHFARADRSGAIGVPSVEILGAGSLSEELEKKPMVYVFGEQELVVGVGSCVAEVGLFGPLSSGVFAAV